MVIGVLSVSVGCPGADAILDGSCGGIDLDCE
jgi:hypothetical protein